MKAVTKQFAVIFFVGFIALAAALAYGSMSTGALLDAHPFLISLRAFGLGFMAAGMALWIALRREEGGKPGPNPLLGLLLAAGCAMLLINLFFPANLLTTYLIGGGLGLTLAALLIGILAMLFAPAYPKPITVRWPEGGESHVNPHIPAIDLHLPNGHPVEPDDLTRIEGIGPKVQEVLNLAGVATFVEVASRSPEELKEILDAAHFEAPADPATWPRQAELAAKGDWEALEALQRELIGGRSTH